MWSKNDLNFENYQSQNCLLLYTASRFCFQTSSEFALTSSCYTIKKQGVILLNYCRSLKTPPPPKKNWKNDFTEKKMDMMVFFSNEHTSHILILVITVNCAKQLISTFETSTQGPKSSDLKLKSSYLCKSACLT